MRKATGGAAAVLWATSAAAALAQPGMATDVLKTDVEAVLASPEGGIDRQIRVVDVGRANVAVGVLHRGPASGANRGIAHTDVTEVYYVLSGSGTLVTGGAVSDRTPLPPDGAVTQVLVGPSLTGAFDGRGSQVREISAGDVVVIPAGVFHGWSDIPDHVTYLSIRPDPDKVLPAGYAHPALTP